MEDLLKRIESLPVQDQRAEINTLIEIKENRIESLKVGSLPMFVGMRKKLNAEIEDLKILLLNL